MLNSIKTVFIVIILIFVNSCREAQYYEYKSISKKILDGVLDIELIANPQNIKEDQVLVYGGPYTLAFRYETKKTVPFYKLRIEDISIQGIESKNMINFNSEEKKKWVSKYSTYHGTDYHGISVIIYEEDKTKNLNYEDYRLKAKVIVYETETGQKTEYIDVILKTDFKKGVRSDTVDKYMGI